MKKCALCGKEAINDVTCLCEECQKLTDTQAEQVYDRLKELFEEWN